MIFLFIDIIIFLKVRECIENSKYDTKSYFLFENMHHRMIEMFLSLPLCYFLKGENFLNLFNLIILNF